MTKQQGTEVADLMLAVGLLPCSKYKSQMADLNRIAGAVVVELLPYNWQWTGINELYRNISRSVRARRSSHAFAS